MLREINNSLLFSVMKKRLKLLGEYKKTYNSYTNKKDITKYQLYHFNITWNYCIKEIPFYKIWFKENHLPSKISSLKDLQNFPLLTKEVLRANEKLIFKGNEKCEYKSTGGSTGTPTKFLSSKKDNDVSYCNTYTGRSWWGVEPFDKIVSLWGHSHLFGSGYKGLINEVKRNVKDKLINTITLNAYDINPQTIIKYYTTILKIKPKAIIGYTSCIYKLSRYIVDNNLDGSIGKQLKVIIPTSESITLNDIKLMKRAFKCEVCCEYGTAETGTIAYSNPQSNLYSVFWKSFICQVDDNSNLKISTISPKFFPLINYYTDDVLNVDDNNLASVITFKSVIGRKKENVKISTKDGKILTVSGILIVHLLKNYENIYSIQTKQLKSYEIIIQLTSSIKLDLQKVKLFFLKNIKIDHPDIDDKKVKFVQTNFSVKTIAGKERVSW